MEAGRGEWTGEDGNTFHFLDRVQKSCGSHTNYQRLNASQSPAHARPPGQLFSVQRNLTISVPDYRVFWTIGCHINAVSQKSCYTKSYRRKTNGLTRLTMLTKSGSQ
ncbi:uncharacterized protein ACNLHF_001630 [Anomaloglossus baeobatrachus]